MRISDWSSDVCSSDLRARGEECDPDRRIRQAGRGTGWLVADRRRGARRARTPAPDPDDQLRLHPRRGAAAYRDRRRGGTAPGARYRGVLRDDLGDGVRPDLHSSEERRVGLECVISYRYGWSTYL